MAGAPRPQRRRIRELLFGSFDYGVLCMPRWPFCHRGKAQAAPFYGPNAALGILTAAVMGLQHALAMAGGLVTPPLLVGMLAPDDATRTYLIQAALLVCGLTTAVQVTGVRPPRRWVWLGSLAGLQWGAGLLSVMGVSFASVPLFTSVIRSQMAHGVPFDVIFGQLLGTTALCACWPLVLSLMPHRALRRAFPPIVTGVTIFLIGCSLVATGFKQWGGGAFCGDNYLHAPAAVADCIIPQPGGGTVQARCFNADAAPLCSNNGEVMLPFGSGPYVGMGLLVFCLIILIELFGSPFMRSAGLVLALLIGLAVASVVRVGGASMLTGKIIAASPAFTFLWTKTFPLGVFPAAIFPLLVVFTITSVETVGDVSATAELSLLPVDGTDHVRRIRGSLLNDGLSGIFSALAGSLPLTTFAQNNGVIALTGVASRWAGWSAAAWLLLFGLLAKFGGLVLSIPSCVLGGATTFLFAAVTVSGLKIIASQNGLNRRNRFIVSCAIAMGLGVQQVPQWASNNLWPEPPGGTTTGVGAVRLAVLLILETGFCIGAIVAFLLNMLMPQELEPSLTVDSGDGVSAHGCDGAAAKPDMQAAGTATSAGLFPRLPDDTARGHSVCIDGLPSNNLALQPPAGMGMGKDVDDALSALPPPHSRGSH